MTTVNEMRLYSGFVLWLREMALKHMATVPLDLENSSAAPTDDTMGPFNKGLYQDDI